MEQIKSLERLSIACRKHSLDRSRSCSELTWMPDNKAEEPTPGSPPSSTESSPIMTPETSDDEEEEDEELHLPEPSYETSSESGEDLPDTPVPEQSEYGGPDMCALSSPEHSPFGDEFEERLAPLTTASDGSEDEDEDSLPLPEGAFGSKGLPGLRTISDVDDKAEDWVHASDAGRANSDDSHQTLLTSPTSTQTDDECDYFFDAPLTLGPYYGSRLAFIREADKIVVEEISREVPRELTRAQMRVLRELKAIHEDETTPFLSVAPIDGNLLNCLASMEGAWGTPWEGGVFWLHFRYPEDYPLKAPVITFVTPVYHPNIADGRVCIDILESAWSPCLQTQTLLLSILSVLHHPILDDALVPEIAEKYQVNYEDFCEMARLYTEDSALGIRPETSELLSLTSGDST